jgi:trigger factor
MSNNYKYDAKVGKDFFVVVTTTISKDKFDETKEKVFNELKKEIKLKGFRKGQGPKGLLEASMGNELYEHTLDHLLPEVMSEVLSEKEFRPITRLDYKVNKLDDSGIEFEASFVNFPEFKLGNFKKIKVKKENPDVSEKDIDAVIENMVKEEEKTGKTDIKVDDKWVEGLGMENIKTLSQLRDEIKKTLEHQKKHGIEDKYTNDVVEEAIKSSKIPIAEKLIEKELELREANYKTRIEELGFSIDEFLSSQKTSLDDMRKEWKKEVEARIAGELLLVKIAEEQNFQTDWSKVQSEIDALEDSKMKEEYNTPEGKVRVSEIVLRQQALKWLVDQVTQA